MFSFAGSHLPPHYSPVFFSLRSKSEFPFVRWPSYVVSFTPRRAPCADSAVAIENPFNVLRVFLYQPCPPSQPNHVHMLSSFPRFVWLCSETPSESPTEQPPACIDGILISFVFNFGTFFAGFLSTPQNCRCLSILREPVFPPRTPFMSGVEFPWLVTAPLRQQGSSAISWN